MLLKDRGSRSSSPQPLADGWPDESHLLERLQDPRVRVLAISLVQFSNGYTVDLARLSAATRASGTYLVVDAIQGVGQVPLDLRETPVDVLACGAQKWLLSPWGSGFVYVRRDLIRDLRPAVTGWMAFEGTDDFTRLTQYDDTLRGDARRFELITLPYQDFAGMNASLRLLLSRSASRLSPSISSSLQAPVLEWAARTRCTGGLAGRRSGLGDPLRRASRCGWRLSRPQGGSGHLRHAGRGHPPESALVQHRRGNGASGRHPGAGMTAFTDMLAAGYAADEPSLVLGAALEGSQVHQEPKVRLPLSMVNRHGLVAGATGTGKTKTLQLLTEQLSAQGVPVFVADMKGDLSGLAMPGEATERVSARASDIGWDWKPQRSAGRVRQPDRRHWEYSCARPSARSDRSCWARCSR